MLLSKGSQNQPCGNQCIVSKVKFCCVAIEIDQIFIYANVVAIVYTHACSAIVIANAGIEVATFA